MNIARIDTAVEEFTLRATFYCALIEHALELSHEQFYHDAISRLSWLSSAALQLPDGVPCSEEMSDEAYHQPTQAQEMLRGLRAELPWELADALLDIYVDVKEGLLILHGDSECAYENAVWHWKFTFETHWGNHLYDVLPRLWQLAQPSYSL
jgi:hypothetical protein